MQNLAVATVHRRHAAQLRAWADSEDAEAARLESASMSSGAADPKHAPVDVPIDELERKILIELARRGRATLQVDLAVALDGTCSERTLRGRLIRLREEKLIARPLGPRKGDVVTAAGRQIVGLAG